MVTTTSQVNVCALFQLVRKVRVPGHYKLSTDPAVKKGQLKKYTMPLNNRSES